MKAQNGCQVAFVLTAFAALGLVDYRPAVAGGFPSENVELLAWLDVGDFGSGSGNDCWGYTSPSGREYALMGLNDKVAVVEITDPINPVIIGSVSHSSSTWCDVKVYQSYAYAVNESGGGIDVIDLSNVDAGSVSLVRRVTSNGMQTSHNIAVNTVSGFLYLAGGNLNGGGLVAWDLSNPTNPVLAGQHNGGDYLHDVQVVTYTSGPNAGREIAFGSSEGRGIDIIDCTDKGNMFLISRTPYPNVTYCHQAWTEDLRYLYINDELDGIQRTTVMDILDLANPIVLGDYNNGTSSTDHNNYVRDGIVFEADYHAGLRIFDANSDPVQPPQIGWFDSYPPNDNSGFDGAWSCYPFFPSGTVIVSDIGRGLFVVDISDALGSLEFTYPNGHPELIDPNGGTRMRVEVSGRGDSQPVPGTGELHYDIGAGWVAEPMEEISDNVYDAVFPAADCAQEVSYYISALSTDESVQTDPSNAPDNAYSVVAASGEDVFFTDDFEADLGWSVQDIDVQTGTWERGVPAGGGGRGDPPTDFDGSGNCFVTDNRFEEDVDGGPTMLISPTFDVSNQEDPQLTYARWFTNDDGDEDSLDVELSDDDGESWTMVESVGGGSGWVVQTVRIADFVQLTSTVKVRFSATDNPNDSVTEAAIDAVAIFDYVCDQAPLLCIVHGDPAWDRNNPDTWTSFEDWAFSAYIDPKVESTDGVNRDLGLTQFDVVFNTEPFGDSAQGPVTAANVSVSVTDGAPPTVANVTKNGNVLTVELNGLMPLQEWTTLDFQVWNADGIEISDNGNEGEGVDECSRLDVGTLPSDVNNDGQTQPLDLSREIASFSDGDPFTMLPDGHIRSGSIADYFDISRDGLFQPIDISRVIAALGGSAPFTRNWNGVGMLSTQP